MVQFKRTLYEPVVALAIAALAMSAQAGTSAYVVNGDDELYRLDLNTLETELVGQIGVDFVYDIASLSDGTIAGQHDDDPGYFLLDGNDANLLAQGQNNSMSGFIGDLDGLEDTLFAFDNTSLREIDPLTGQANELFTLSTPTSADSLAMVSGTEAFVFGRGDIGLRELYRVDFDTGEVETVLSIVEPSLFFRSLDYHDGVLYALMGDGSLSIVDQADGSLTSLGALDIGAVDAFTIVPAPGTTACAVLVCAAAIRRRR
ncbi:MAG: hypothetical protein AAGA55_12170 [Planctomycetota bacterium]